jgi:hypothetical protein
MYTAPGGVMRGAIDALHATGALEPRVVQPSAALLEAQREVSRLVVAWDDARAARLAADNLFLDETAERRKRRIRDELAKLGACQAPEAIEAENALRGSWKIPCERGYLYVSITLSPTSQPKVQSLAVTAVVRPADDTKRIADAVLDLVRAWDQKRAEEIAAPGLDLERVRRVASAAGAWGACESRGIAGGDGVSATVAKLTCAKGTLYLRVEIDPATRKLANVVIVPSRDERCVP